MPPPVPDEAADYRGDDRDAAPAADAQPRADAVPDEDPEQELAEDARLREPDTARSDAAPVLRVRLRDACVSVQVAGRPPFLAGLPPPLQPDARAARHPRLDLPGVRLHTALAAGAVTLRARPLDDGAAAAAARARLRE